MKNTKKGEQSQSAERSQAGETESGSEREINETESESDEYDRNLLAEQI